MLDMSFQYVAFFPSLLSQNSSVAGGSGIRFHGLVLKSVGIHLLSTTGEKKLALIHLFF